MTGGGRVTVDADKAIELLDGIRREVNERIDDLGRFLAEGMTTKPSAPARRRPAEKEQDAMELDHLDISGIEWQLSNRDGGGLAGPEAGWCWAFSTTQDGGVHREAMQLVQALEQYGKVRVGLYELSLGGRDGNLLNRKKVKK